MTTPEQPPFPPPQPPSRSWWNRNWKWVVPVGCLTPLVVCGGCITIIFTTVFGTLKSSEVYKESLALVQQDPQVQSALGAPVEPSFFVFGSVSVDSTTGGDAQISYPVSGPNGAGVVNAAGTKTGDTWVIESLEVQIEPGNQIITLIPSEIMPGSLPVEAESDIAQ